MRTCKIGYLNGARACSMQLKIIMNSDHINLGDIAYEQIDGKYWFGLYGDFNVCLIRSLDMSMCRSYVETVVKTSNIGRKTSSVRSSLQHFHWMFLRLKFEPQEMIG